MVFESIVVDLLNRLLGDYFENLDTSQLKLGIWGGDVVLRDLLLRNSALDDLNVPFKIVVGKLGSLTVKIPWQSLYTAPVELKLTDLLLLVAPSYSVKYDAVAEEKAAQFAKKKEIERIDDIRRKEQAKKEDPKPQADDTFTEKLITQIIKNVQIKIETIHFRYEDDVTKPHSPFGFGVILKNLELQTTDGEWNPAVVTEAAQTFNKLATLEGLSVYWNSRSELLQSNRSSAEMLKLLRDYVVSNNIEVTHVLGPINSTAKLTLTPSPDRGAEPFSKPKFMIDVLMQELALGMTNLQFQDIIELAESIDFMFRAQLYRKYRPAIKEHGGHYKAWWKYAYQCIIEEDVRRRRNNWDWNHMKWHRNLCKTYANVYYQKLTQLKLKAELINTINHCEMELDLFNITLVRKQVEMRIEKEGKRKEQEKQTGGGGWLSGWGWFQGNASPESTDLTVNAILGKVEEALTPAEKSKLYSAIDYTENALPLDYPQEYLEYCLSFTLKKLSTTVREFGGRGRERKGHTILQLEIDDVETQVMTRPVKNGMQVIVSMASLNAVGMQTRPDVPAPVIVESKITKGETNLFHVQFEANPLNCNANQRIVVRGNPIEVVYDGKTVSELVNCFTLPSDAKLTRLQAAAVSTINDWKEQSTAGLQYLLDTRAEKEVDIHLIAPYFLVPQGGLLVPDISVLVMDLGEISVKSKPREKNWNKEKISSFKKSFETEEQFLKAMMKIAYDTFIIELRDFQIFISLPDEDYVAAVSKTQPTGKKLLPKTLIHANKFIVTLEQLLIPEDPRFPRLQIQASLPLLGFDITEDRLVELLKLLVTLPFPHAEEQATPSLSVISESTAVAESYAISKITYSDAALEKKEKKLVEIVEMLIRFTVDAVKIRLTRMGSRNDAEVPFADFEMNHLQLRLKSKSYSSSIDVGIGGLTLCALQNTIPNHDGPLYLLKTPMSEGSETYLLKMHMFSIMPNCPPQFAGKVKQSIKADISSLDVILHQEAISSVLGLLEKVTKTLEESVEKNRPLNPETISLQSTSSTESRRKARSNTQVSRLEARRRAVAKKHKDPNDVLLQIDAKMESLTVQMSYENKNLIKAVLSSMDFSMLHKTGKMSICLELTNLSVKNLDPHSLYKDIITVNEDRVVYIKIMMFDEGSKGRHFFDMDRHDMSVRIETGSPKIIYLNPFLDEVLNFLFTFGTTREAMLEASAAAAAAAKESVEQSVAGASRILLDISLKAPLVIIPRNEKSPHAMLADLGHLTLKNHFEKRKVGEAETYIIVDRMEINLMNVKVSRVFFNKTIQQYKSEVLMLEPVNCKFWIDRNLSADAYHGMPDMVVKGTIRAATMRMSNEDYDLMLGCVLENIVVSPPSDGNAAAKGSQSGKRKSKVKSVDVEKKESDGSMRTLVSAPSMASSKAEVYINMQTYLMIPQLKFVMYEKGVVNLETNDGVVERDEATAFASIAVQNVSLNFESFNNGNTICPIVIENVSLLDIRPGPRAIKSLIHRKLDDKTTGGGPIVNFNYKFAENSGATMELETTSLTLVLALDYLMKILAFFQTSGPSPEIPKQDVTLRLEPTSVLPTDPVPAREITAGKPGVTEREDSPSSEMWNAFYNFSSTEIILVETMERIDTKALLLNCEVVFKQTDADGKSNIMGTISNLKLNSCIYNPTLRESSSAEVISPMSITVVWNSSQTTGSLIDVNISNIFVRLTAGTVELLVKIFGSIGATKIDENALIEKVNYSDIWDVKDANKLDLWFLRPEAWYEVAQDALALEDKQPMGYEYAMDLEPNERLVLESGAIVFTFETGTGNITMPMLLVETDIDLQVFDWSRNMKVAGRMKLEAAYYNAMFGLWEFLIEPVETRHHGRVAHQPWEVLFEYAYGPANSSPDSTPTNLPNPKTTSMLLQSNDVLELTVTKTALNTISMISEDFSSAVKELVSRREVSTAPYSIVNNTGMDIKLYLKEKGKPGPFILIKNGMEYEEVILKHGTFINLGLVEETDLTKHHTSVLREQEGRADRLLTVEIPQEEFKNSIPVNRSAKRYFPFKANVDHGHYGMICDIGVRDCSKIVTLRGVVQVVNDLEVPVDIYYMADGGKTAKLAGTALQQNVFNLPIPCTYTESCNLFFAPEGYSVTTQPFRWDDVFREIQVVKQLSCCFRKAGHDDFHIRVVGVAKQALHECSNRKNIASQCCFIYLKPPVKLDNLLPVPIGYYVDQKQHRIKMADRGCAIQVTNLITGKDEEYHLYLKIPDYKRQSWRCDVIITKYTEEVSSWLFISDDNVHESLTLGIHRELSNDEIILHLYCPFWMINRTGLSLIYKGDGRDSPQTTHLRDVGDKPIMFSFSGKGFFSKKSANVKVQDGHITTPSMTTDWSEKFSLDAAGSCGSVTCKSPMQNFQIGVEIQLSGWGLTRYVIFTPRFYLANQCPYSVYVVEEERPDGESEVPAGKCIPFWPKSQVPNLKAVVKILKRRDETAAFRYDVVEHTLLQLSNEYGGLHVDICLTESKTSILFDQFVPSQAPVLLINKNKVLGIELSEKESHENFHLGPGKCQYFTWKNPLGSRMLEWWPAGKKDSRKHRQQNNLLMDGFGTFEVERKGEKTDQFWISFLDGSQRYLMFVDDSSIVQMLQTREVEVATAEYTVTLHGLGLSLVDNENLKEVMYMRIASSDIVWEQCKDGKRKRYKPLQIDDSKAVEAAYQNYLNHKAISKTVKSLIQLDSGLEVDFYVMRVIKPQAATIRRVFQTGIWISYKTLPHSTQLHAKLNRIQIDNQLTDGIFRVVLAPVKPPKTISSIDASPKPFVEISIMQRTSSHSYVVQYKYFKVLIQEFLVRLDIGFVNALVELFGGNSTVADEWKDRYLKEYDEVCTALDEFLARQIVQQGQKHFYDYLHFSPLKIHLSFSMVGSTNISNHLLKLIIASLGVTLTEIQDVIFKLACFELHHTFLSSDQLQDEVYSHYWSQGVRQLYVIVFGLDVIGNPYGLAMGVAKGVEAFFYEPFQGAIQGPGEFAEGVALGVKSLLGGTIGGTAGAFSKITGTLGKGIAALTFDDDYQKKRRENLQNRGDAAEGFARSGKGLVMGFYEGLTGIVTKPVEGCKEGGAAGFFKGAFKGTVGLVARPAAGVVDFASGSFDAVKKATSATEDVRRLRPPRYIPADTILQPYICHEAEGVQLLNELEKGKYSNTDNYVAHALINPHGIYVLLVTNRRVLYLKRDELFGTWATEWNHIWEEFSCPPEIVERGLLFTLKQELVKKIVLFRIGKSKQLLVPIYSAEVATRSNSYISQWLVSKIEEAMRTETGMTWNDDAGGGGSGGDAAV
ncbi:Vacuolar protein sorting-associated protein 13A [Orchesella cincta]|uniref:Vacuolar protein sorting-associated protein 13A n=1 Tax=Orchesella cincta TaxID=48709 RepID=A0A1D2NBW2_ORCCI|nr:Vacuolar protein sorting-associated protein 13A [Orchesella cincta]